MDDDPKRDAGGGAKGPLRPSVSATLNAAGKAARALGRKAGEAGGRVLDDAGERISAGVAAGLHPARDLGRAAEGQRIAVEHSIRMAFSSTAAGAKRAAWGVGLHGANLTGAAATFLLDYTGSVFGWDVGVKYLDIRQEVAEALAKYGRLQADMAQTERERLAAEAVERLTAWDHRRTVHHRSAWLHVSTGPGRKEAWGIVLRGPHAGRSLASLEPEVLAALWAEAPDAETAASLEAWREVVVRAAG